MMMRPFFEINVRCSIIIISIPSPLPERTSSPFPIIVMSSVGNIIAHVISYIFCAKSPSPPVSPMNQDFGVTEPKKPNRQTRQPFHSCSLRPDHPAERNQRRWQWRRSFVFSSVLCNWGWGWDDCIGSGSGCLAPHSVCSACACPPKPVRYNIMFHCWAERIPVQIVCAPIGGSSRRSHLLFFVLIFCM